MEMTQSPFVQHGPSIPGLSMQTQMLGAWICHPRWTRFLARHCPGTTQGPMCSRELPRSKKTRYEINPNFSDSLVTTNCFPHLIFSLFLLQQ